MLHFDTAQMAAITQAHFFSRVAEFIRNQTTVGAYREAASDTTLRTALWAPHWSTLRSASEHDAALFMCFLLACATLGLDATRAAEAVRQSSQPETRMKLFLSERGLLRFSAFDVPELTHPCAAA
jgi:UDP-N-acetylmuramyl pentapeptide synthase